MSKLVHITVLISFNGLYRGETATVVYDDKVRGWERLGLIRAVAELEVTAHAESEAGPGGTVPDDPGSFTG